MRGRHKPEPDGATGRSDAGRRPRRLGSCLADRPRSCIGYRVDLALAVITCIIQIPVIHNWSGYPYLTVFQVMRVHRLIFGIKPIGELVVCVCARKAPCTPVVSEPDLFLPPPAMDVRVRVGRKKRSGRSVPLSTSSW